MKRIIGIFFIIAAIVMFMRDGSKTVEAQLIAAEAAEMKQAQTQVVTTATTAQESAVTVPEWYADTENCVGWITIGGTKVDYPIMWEGEKEDPADPFYLHHSFDGTKTSNGAIFMRGVNHKEMNDNIVLIYGHHMKSGAMFAGLESFKYDSFFREDREVKLSTITGERQLKPVAVVVVPDAEPMKTAMTAGEIESFLNDKTYTGANGKIYNRYIYQNDGVDLSKRMYFFITCSYEEAPQSMREIVIMQAK